MFLLEVPIFSQTALIAASNDSPSSNPNFLIRKFFLTVSNSDSSEQETTSASFLKIEGPKPFVTFVNNSMSKLRPSFSISAE